MPNLMTLRRPCNGQVSPLSEEFCVRRLDTAAKICNLTWSP